VTPKQADRIQNQIKKIKRALAADKKRWGGFYDDSRGLRYLPPEFYLKLQDYTGALRYFNWFKKNFPDDIGFPGFLFEWTVTLFKTKKLEQAENKAIETFFSNTYLLDKFLGKEFLELDISEHSNWEKSNLAKYFHYSKDQKELADFAEWLGHFVTGEKFYKIANEFIDIERKLKTEPVGPKRSALVKRRYQLIDDLEQE
jgi:hypothetical protein